MKINAMDKEELKAHILKSFYSIDSSEYTELVVVLNKLMAESADTADMAAKFTELPQYKLLTELLLLKKAESAKTSLAVIKVLIVIYFICSIITAIYLAVKLI
jgi:hypothetical protein